jgi:hypothetical protein
VPLQRLALSQFEEGLVPMHRRNARKSTHWEFIVEIALTGAHTHSSSAVAPPLHAVYQLLLTDCLNLRSLTQFGPPRLN